MRKGIFVLLAAMLAGCRAMHPTVAEKITADSTRSVTVQHDSIFVRDSIFVVERGDTVFETKYRYVYRDRVLRDTFHYHRCDTVTCTVEVEKELTFWQQKKMELGGAVAWIAPFIAAIMVIKWKFL